jgi:glyceraldehyde-3-phosphate dehydrogenase (NADP+)
MKTVSERSRSVAAPVLEVRDPQDGSLVGAVPRADAEVMRSEIGIAEAATGIARKIPAYRRAEVLRRAAEAVAERREEFAQTVSREGVKTIREARKEAARCAETLRLSAEEALRLGGETIPFDGAPGGEGRVGWYGREPVGVVGAITPFNDPLNLVAHKVGPAIAGGNAVVLKPHEETPLSALLFARTLYEAGLPEEMLRVVVGAGPEVGQALIADARVRMISFTGGRRTGEEILRSSGLKRVSMELGSNAPTIVMPDADLEAALEAVVSGAFSAAGQNCLHVQRLLLHEEVYASFAERFAAAARAVRAGPKEDEESEMGPMINEAAARRVEKMVDAAVKAGAKLLAGGRRSGTHYAPTVLEDVPEECAVAKWEVFGPVTVLRRFRTLDEAVAIANGVDYGLQAAIFTKDLATAFKAVYELRCGAVVVNDSTDYRIDAMPFGGVKGSGLRCEGVKFALEEMTEPKVACFNLGEVP